MCARGKSSHQPPVGILQPLEIPRCPLTHIVVDFVTGLPPSEGHQVTTIVINWFSKASHFNFPNKAPVSGGDRGAPAPARGPLPLDLEGLVSDRGPQFCSQVWRAFCWGLGASHRPTGRWREPARAWWMP